MAEVRISTMWYLWIALIVLVSFALAVLAAKIVKRYEQEIPFRLGRAVAVRKAGLTVMIPFADVLNRVSLRIITGPIPSQGASTGDNSTAVFPAPQMSTIGERGTLLDRTNAAPGAPPRLVPINGIPLTTTAS